jgi:hypothetical protein
MEIILTPEIERALLEQAQQQGTTPEELALESLRRQFVRSAQSKDSPETYNTLADFLAGYIGILHSSEHVSGGVRMSV